MDKNGVVSTKWVRPDSGEAAVSSFPAPGITATSAEPDFDVHATHVSSVYSGTIMAEETGYTIEDFDPKAVKAVDTLITDAAPEWKDAAVNSTMLAFRHSYKRVLTRRDDDNLSWAHRPFNNLGVFGGISLDDEALHNDTYSLVNGMMEYMGDRDYLNDATDAERAQAIALVTVASRLEEDYLTMSSDRANVAGNSITITSSRLAAYVMEYPEEAASIAQAVNERGSDDPDVIREVLQFEQQALRDGVL